MPWLFLSSGARPPYIENVARSLALFPHEHVQVRYDEKLLSPKFKAADLGALKGQRGYLAFLGDATADGELPIVPVREVTICRCERRGSSYVIRLSMGRYLHGAGSGENVAAAIRALASEGVPVRQDGSPKGFWASALESDLDSSMLVAHGYDSGSHLAAFEQTADLLSAQSAFEEPRRQLFLNILDIVDSEDLSVLRPNARPLKAGDRYRLLVYHYYKGKGSSEDRKPYWLVLEAKSDDLEFRSADAVKIESPYDERQFSFELDPEARSQLINLNVRLLFDKKDGDETLDIHLVLRANARIAGALVKMAVMTAGLTLAQSSVLIATGKMSSGAFLFVFLGSVIAAFAAVFDFKRSI